MRSDSLRSARRLGSLLAAAAALAVVVFAGHGAIAASSGGGTTVSPPYQSGPQGGDQYNVIQADPSSGTVTIARAYPYPGAFNCAGNGGYATFLATPTLTAAASSVSVDYTNSAWDSYTWVTLTVRDAATGAWLANGELRGPVAGSGTFSVPLTPPAAAGTTLSIQFGLQVASACPNADGGSVTFSAVTAGGATPSVPPPQPLPQLPGGLTSGAGLITTSNFEYVPGDKDYLTQVPLQIVSGQGLVLANVDVNAPHTVTSDVTHADGTPLFDSGDPISAGQAALVTGASALAPGTYTFHCKTHTWMMGILQVVPSALPELPPVPGLPSPPPPPAAPGSAIVAGPEAQFAGYATRATVASKTGTLTFYNADIVEHDVVSTTPGLFSTPLIGLGQSARVQGVENLTPGNTYTFYCTIHPGMTGTLLVTP